MYLWFPYSVFPTNVDNSVNNTWLKPTFSCAQKSTRKAWNPQLEFVASLQNQTKSFSTRDKVAFSEQPVLWSSPHLQSLDTSLLLRNSAMARPGQITKDTKDIPALPPQQTPILYSKKEKLFHMKRGSGKRGICLQRTCNPICHISVPWCGY